MTTAVTKTLDEKLSDLFASEPWAVNARVEILRELRETAPVYPFAGTVLVSPLDDVRDVLGDADRFSNQHHTRGSRAQRARARLTTDEGLKAFDDVMAFESNFLNRNDSPDHKRMRGVAHRAFTPARIKELQEKMGEHQDEIFGSLSGNETVDMAELLGELPLLVICDMIGVPPEDRDRVRVWDNALAANRYGQAEKPLIAAHHAWIEFRDYVGELIERHKKSPGSGGPLVDSLLDAHEGDVLTENEIKSLFVMLLEGGFETTSNLLGIGLYYLLSEPEQWKVLVAEPELLPNAVEELLRLVSPAAFTSRVALAPVELHGVKIEPETTVVSSNAAANRDPLAFSDPDHCDVRRADARKHIAFGHGPHFCLGASLTRIEATTGLTKLTQLFPRMELATDRVEFVGSSSLRRLAELPVVLGPRAD